MSGTNEGEREQEREPGEANPDRNRMKPLLIHPEPWSSKPAARLEVFIKCYRGVRDTVSLCKI